MVNPKKNSPVDYDDPFDAIFALNIGDFVVEDLFSSELLDKISTKINRSPQEKVEQLKNQLKELVSIYSIGNTLNLLGFEGEEGFILYDSIAVTISQMMGMDCCHIFMKPDILPLLNKKTSCELVLFGTSEKIKERDFGYPFGDTNIQTKAYKTKKTLYIKDLKKELYWKGNPSLSEDKAKTFLSSPMVTGTHPIGLITLYSYDIKEIPQENIQLLEAISGIFAASISLQELMEDAMRLAASEEATYEELTSLRAQMTVSIGDLGIEQQRFVETLALAVDAKSKYTKDHSQSVADLARDIAKEMNLNEKTLDLIYYAGLLQNIGRIIIPSEVFSKKEKLSDDEWKKIQEHPNVGVDLLMKVNFLAEVVPYVNYHRERWDGKGYPEGLAGMSIPLGSRIIAVADAYQAMISERVYRNPIPKEEAVKLIQKEAGIKWDPLVVEALTRVVQ